MATFNLAPVCERAIKMKTEFEKIQTDPGSSFRLLHQRLLAEDYTWSYHYHPEYELVWIKEGTGRRHVGNHLGHYENGDLVLVGKNLPHSGFGYGAIGLHEEVVIQFTEDFQGSGFLQIPEMKQVQLLLLRSMQGMHFTGNTRQQAGKRLFKLHRLPPFERLQELLSILQFLSRSDEYHLLNAANTQYDFGSKDQERLKRVYEYVEGHYKEPLNMKAVAAIATLTVPSFCHYFKKNMRLTFTDFVNEYRINQSCRLLLEGNSISDACFNSGFNNVSYFSKLFKQLKGKSPGQYQRLVARV